MNSKRKFSDVNNVESSGNGQMNEYAHDHQAFRNKKRKSNNTKTKPTSINWTKTRARTIERRLKHEANLPANVRHDLEKELEHHKLKLEDLTDEKKRKDMITKYHMVRFFERKKADRLAKQIRTKLRTTTDEEEKKMLEIKLHVAEMDSLYARYFPHRERYVSLYPVAVKGAPKVDEASSAARALQLERPPMWEIIEKASKKGESALRQIQERRSPGDTERMETTTQDQQPSKYSSTKKDSNLEHAHSHRSKSKQQPSPEPISDGNDSDGGFFEEG